MARSTRRSSSARSRSRSRSRSKARTGSSRSRSRSQTRSGASSSRSQSRSRSRSQTRSGSGRRVTKKPMARKLSGRRGSARKAASGRRKARLPTSMRGGASDGRPRSTSRGVRELVVATKGKKRSRAAPSNAKPGAAPAKPTKEESCVAIFNRFTLMEAEPSPADVLVYLEELGYEESEIIELFNSKGYRYMYELLEKECNRKVPDFKGAAPAAIQDLAADLSKQQIRTAEAHSKLIERQMDSDLTESSARVFESALAIAKDAAAQELAVKKNIRGSAFNLQRLDIEKARWNEHIRKLQDQQRQAEGQRDMLQGRAATLAQARALEGADMISQEIAQAQAQLAIIGDRHAAFHREIERDAALIQGNDIILVDRAVIEKQFERVYGSEGGKQELAKLPVNAYVRDAEGRPRYIRLRSEDMSGLLKEALAIKAMLVNMERASEGCAALLTKHGLTTKASWDALIDFCGEKLSNGSAQEQATAKHILETLFPCIMEAINASKIIAYNDLSEYVDNHGFITQPATGDAFLQSFQGENVHIPKFVKATELGGIPKDDAKAAFDEWFSGEMRVARDPGTQGGAASSKAFLRYVGTGFELGPEPLLPKPAAEMLKSIMSGSSSDPEYHKAALGALKKAYESMPAARAARARWEELSPLARQMLELRRQVIQNVTFELSTYSPDDVACDELGAVEEFIGSNENPRSAHARLAQLSRGLLQPFGFKDARGDIVGKAAEGVFRLLNDSLANAISGVSCVKRPNRKPSQEQALFALVRAMDATLNVSLDCKKIASMPQAERKPYFERLMKDLVQGSLQATQSGTCQLTARTLDVILAMNTPEMAAVRKELEQVAPLGAVDTILMTLGLPCQKFLLGKGVCSREDMKAVYTAFDFDSGLREACNRIRAALKSEGFNIEKDCAVQDLRWNRLIACIIDAAVTWRYVKYTFLTSDEYEESDIWSLLKQDQFLLTTKQFAAGVSGAAPGTVTAFIDGLRVGADPHELIKQLDQFREYAKKFGAQGTDPDVASAVTNAGRGAGKFPIVLLHPIVLKSVAVNVGGINPDAMRLASDLFDDGSEVPVVLAVLERASMQMLRFEGVVDSEYDSRDLLYLGEDVFDKQVTIMSKQAKQLCMLPTKDCKGGCMVVGEDCLAVGRMQLETGKDGKKVRWAPNVEFSRTRVVAHGQPGSALRPEQSVIAVGYDAVSEMLLPGSSMRAELIARYEKVRAIHAFRRFTEELRRRPAEFLSKAPDGKAMFKDLAEKIAQRRTVLRMLRDQMRCDGVCSIIEACAKFVEVLMKAQRAGKINGKAEVSLISFGADEDGGPSSVELQPFFAAVFDAMTEGSGSGFIRSATVTVFGEEIKISLDKPLALPKAIAARLLNNLVLAIFDHFMDIEYFRCDVDEKVACNAIAKRGVPCAWDVGTCYNTMLTDLKYYSRDSALLGVVHRELLPHLKAILADPNNAIPTAEKYGVRELLSALFGDELINSYAFMDPVTRDVELAKIVDQRYFSTDEAKKALAKS